jgi:hypothetical protein
MSADEPLDTGWSSLRCVFCTVLHNVAQPVVYFRNAVRMLSHRPTLFLYGLGGRLPLRGNVLVPNPSARSYCGNVLQTAEQLLGGGNLEVR